MSRRFHRRQDPDIVSTDGQSRSKISYGDTDMFECNNQDDLEENGIKSKSGDIHDRMERLKEVTSSKKRKSTETQNDELTLKEHSKKQKSDAKKIFQPTKYQVNNSERLTNRRKHRRGKKCRRDEDHTKSIATSSEYHEKKSKGRSFKNINQRINQNECLGHAFPETYGRKGDLLAEIGENTNTCTWVGNNYLQHDSENRPPHLNLKKNSRNFGKYTERDVLLWSVGNFILSVLKDEPNMEMEIHDLSKQLPESIRENLDFLHDGKEDALQEFLEHKASHVFGIHGNTVAYCPSLTICQEFTEQQGKCTSENCTNLHICMYFFLGNKCPYGEQCKYGHKTCHHNELVLAYHFVKDEEFFKLLLNYIFHPDRRPFFLKPKVCRFYNCQTKCQKMDLCHCLHICKYFIENKCRFPDCKRLHSLENPHSQSILEKYGLLNHSLNSEISLNNLVVNAM